MKRTYYFAYLLRLFIGFPFISCEDDEGYMGSEGEGEILKQPVLPPSIHSTTLMWKRISESNTVISKRTHQNGQKNRSSENFSFKGMEDLLDHKYACIVWETEDPNMMFRVKIDVSGTDLDYNEGYYITNGSITLVDDNVRKHIDKFYVANPVNIADPTVTSGEFNVKYRVFEPIYGHIFMACSNGEGKASQRVSDNMDFTASHYRMHTADSINIDPEMNSSLKMNLDTIKGQPNSRSGVVMMDFYSKHGYDDTLKLVPRIIGLNFD